MGIINIRQDSDIRVLGILLRRDPLTTQSRGGCVNFICSRRYAERSISFLGGCRKMSRMRGGWSGALSKLLCTPSQSAGLKTKNEVRLPLALLLSTPVCRGWVENSHISCSEPGALCQVKQETLQFVLTAGTVREGAGNSGSFLPFFLGCFW